MTEKQPTHGLIVSIKGVEEHVARHLLAAHVPQHRLHADSHPLGQHSRDIDLQRTPIDCLTSQRNQGSGISLTVLRVGVAASRKASVRPAAATCNSSAPARMGAVLSSKVQGAHRQIAKLHMPHWMGQSAADLALC